MSKPGMTAFQCGQVERNLAIVAARDVERLTWNAIGERFLLSKERIRQIYTREKRKPLSGGHTLGTSGLSTRAFNCLKRAGFTEHTTHEELKAQIGRIRQGIKGDERHGGIRNFGFATLAEVEEWLGVDPLPADGKRRCPHCGEVLTGEMLNRAEFVRSTFQKTPHPGGDESDPDYFEAHDK